MTGVWTVFTSWRASGPVSAAETSQTFTDWPSARRQARDLVCCRDARYVSVQGPGDVVVAEWDRYSNRWREYPRALAVVGAVAGAAQTGAAQTTDRSKS